MVATYHDGYIALNKTTPNINMEKIFYPEWWLKVVNYNKGPVNPYWSNPDVIEFASNPSSSTAGSTVNMLLVVIFTSLISLFVGYMAGKSSTKARDGGSRYQVVPGHHERITEMTYTTSYQAVA